MLVNDRLYSCCLEIIANDIHKRLWADVLANEVDDGAAASMFADSLISVLHWLTIMHILDVGRCR